MRRLVDPISILTCLAFALALALAGPLVLGQDRADGDSAGEGADNGADTETGTSAAGTIRPAATVPVLTADERRAQVRAARDAALGALRQEVLAAPVGPDLTVADVVDRAARDADGGADDDRAGEPGSDPLAPALDAAEQVGDARPIGEWGYEVRVEVDGTEVARTLLLSVADDEPEDLEEAFDRSADELAEQIRRLRGRRFSGLGVSMGRIEHLRPPPALGAWRRVGDEVRETALSAARRDAAERVLDSVRSVELPEGKSVGDALEVREVRDALADWLMRRPVTSVEFREDLEVRVGISAPADEFWQVFENEMSRGADVPFPQDAGERDALRKEIERRLEPTVGRSRAKLGRRVAPPPEPVRVPREAPEWVEEQINATGTGSDPESELKAKWSAETDARERLRSEVDALPLSGRTKLGDAARQDPRIDEALARGLEQATVSKIIYDPSGDVEVLMSLDLEEVWRELEAEAGEE